MTMRTFRLWGPLAAAALAIGGTSCGDDTTTPDTGGDDGTVEIAADADADVPAEAEAEVGADADADVEPDLGPAVCGNGTTESGEVCDDGNTVNEACGTTDPAACLADCSLVMSLCGNSTVDPGEQCDDGNTDSFDDCTTSCTINDHNIGAPCRCTADCDDIDMTAGTIEGCENVVAPGDGTAELACGRSINNTTYGVQVYAAEGSCTLMAMGCTGTELICTLAPAVGNVDAFECPAPYIEGTDVREIMGATITTKLCGVPCDSQTDCRWNAVEAPDSPWAGECGQWQCLYSEDAGVNLCNDPRP
jgi:cysteine-rich repeat protein